MNDYFSVLQVNKEQAKISTTYFWEKYLNKKSSVLRKALNREKKNEKTNLQLSKSNIFADIKLENCVNNILKKNMKELLSSGHVLSDM